MTRSKDVERWLKSTNHTWLVQLETASKSTDSVEIATWVVENNWLPPQYEPSFPYPEIVLGANHPDLESDIPNSFKPLSVALPPMLLSMAGVKGESRFVALYYMGSKATWTDGRSCATFPFYTVWQPYIDHIAIAIELFDCHLGSDDCHPSQALVCDCLEQKVYVGEFGEVQKFLSRQHPPRQPISEEEWLAIKAQILAQPPLELEQLEQLGMFELFSSPTPQQIAKATELVAWLDGFIDERLLGKYLNATELGDDRAAWHLEQFYRRLETK
jgi:hypothetical protein